MTNLQRVLKIWDNLEESFLNSGMDIRLDYLYKIIGYDKEENITAIDSIKSRMNQEMARYNENELKEYSSVMGLLTNVDILVRSGSIKRIDNLNEFRAYIANNGEIATEKATKKLNETFFEDINLLKQPNAIESKANSMDFETIYSLYGTIGDTFTEKDGKVDKVYMSDTDDCFILSTNMKFADLQKAKKGTFKSRVLEACFALADAGKLVKYVTLINNKFAKVKGNEVTIKIGDNIQTFTLTKRNLLGDTGIFHVNLGTNFGEVKCYFV